MNRQDFNRSNGARQEGGRTPRPKPNHDMALSACVKQRGILQVVLRDGTEIKGQIHSFDQWTITLDRGVGQWPLTIYKHDISTFTRKDPRPV